MPFNLKLYKDGKLYGTLGPYRTRRAAAIDAMTMITAAGVPRSTVSVTGGSKPRVYSGHGKGNAMYRITITSQKKKVGFKNPRRNGYRRNRRRNRRGYRRRR